MRPCQILAALAVLFASACATTSATPRTRYRLGDYVVYRYQGPGLAEPVTLREEVTAQEGNRLRIDVTAARAAEERRWVQVLTDTPENQKANKIDALYESVNGGYVKLANADNRDVYRLYEWTLFVPDKPASGIMKSECQRPILNHEMTCRCTNGQSEWKGAVLLFEATECPAFLWTNGTSRFTDAATGEDVLKVEVLEQGRKAAAAQQTFEP
ncbi:MAG TPA: hypothetical protein VGK67_21995 [Myxococcales bacterium]|jgi:hypothetical protein